jgi:signal transduction histidine kinase
LASLAVIEATPTLYRRRVGVEFAVTLATALLCAGAVVLVAGASDTDQVDRALREALIICVPVGAGLYSLRSPHDARFGALLIASGLVWSLTALAEADDSLLYSIGRVAAWTVFPLLVYLMLAFPAGRIASPSDRRLLGGTVVLIGLLYISSALFVHEYPRGTPWASCTTNCPANAFLLFDHTPHVVHVILGPVRDALAIVLLLGVSVALGVRTRAASPLLRLQVEPVVLAGLGWCLTLVAYLATRRFAPDSGAVETLGVAWSLWVPALAAAFLVGVMRRRLRVARLLEGFSVALSGARDGGQLRAALMRALGDDEADLLLLDGTPPRWHDTQRRFRSLADIGGEGRAVTLIGDPRDPTKAIVHDARLADDDELLVAVGSLVDVALREQQLETRLRASLSELEDSRKRIVVAADRARSRIERDLHDGAQQRLIMLRIKLTLAEELLAVDHAAGVAAVHELGAEVDRALDDLRSLAHGVYPPLLSDRGLGDALRGIAAESTLPIHLDVKWLTRLPTEIETAVYFICLEALQNIGKHAPSATGAWITVRQRDALTLEIRDDGCGFDASAAREGGGLRNMRDRVEAVGGELAVDSLRGHGTRVAATIPLG